MDHGSGEPRSWCSQRARCQLWGGLPALSTCSCVPFCFCAPCIQSVVQAQRGIRIVWCSAPQAVFARELAFLFVSGGLFLGVLFLKVHQKRVTRKVKWQSTPPPPPSIYKIKPQSLTIGFHWYEMIKLL